jgi:hypothetical protein
MNKHPRRTEENLKAATDDRSDGSAADWSDWAENSLHDNGDDDNVTDEDLEKKPLRKRLASA